MTFTGKLHEAFETTKVITVVEKRIIMFLNFDFVFLEEFDELT